MAESVVCPFYAKSDDICDVGCGYISPHDAKMIIKFCSCNFAVCMKYRELSDRYPAMLPRLATCS